MKRWIVSTAWVYNILKRMNHFVQGNYMKRIFYGIMLAVAVSGAAFAQKLTIKNIFGADKDELFGDYDLFTQTKETDYNGDTKSEDVFLLGDRLQADYKSKILSGRLRLDMLYKNADEDTADFVMAPSGFIHFTPIKQLGFAAGNNFFSHFAIPSCYLAAADETTKYGRLLTDSLGHEEYWTTGNAAIYGTAFASGITSEWGGGKHDPYYARAAAGSTLYTDFDGETEYAIDAGINIGIPSSFDFGATAHDLTHDDRKLGVFAGLTAVPNLILNAGFYYNFTASDYLPEARVTRKDDDGNYYDKFKKQKTKYALGISGGYTFKDAGFGIFADVISGLTNEYIDEIEWCDNDGNTVETKTTTIVRGSTIVKYKQDKNGVYKAKRTDEFSHSAIPLYSQLRLTYDVAEDLNVALNVKLRTMINDGSQTWLTLYPHATFALPDAFGDIKAGLRFDMNLTRYDEGFSGFSIPVTYTYKFKKDFRK